MVLASFSISSSDGFSKALREIWRWEVKVQWRENWWVEKKRCAERGVQWLSFEQILLLISTTTLNVMYAWTFGWQNLSNEWWNIWEQRGLIMLKGFDWVLLILVHCHGIDGVMLKVDVGEGYFIPIDWSRSNCCPRSDACIKSCKKILNACGLVFVYV